MENVVILAAQRTAIGGFGGALASVAATYLDLTCAVTGQSALDPAKINPNGGAVALGHPIGASGAINLTKLVHKRARTNACYGAAAMCIGGDQGIAVSVENL